MIENLKRPKLPVRTLIIAAGAVLSVFTVFIIFQLRSPVLILSEDTFNALYGTERLKNEIFHNSAALFRRVKLVTVANDAGEDIIPHAISEISTHPYCVLFPYRFVRSAKLYKDKNPDIPVIILEGRNAGTSAEFDYKYKTDIENDLNKAGLAAFLIAAEGKIAVFLESSIEKPVKDAFLRGLDEEKAAETRFYTNYSSYDKNAEVSCAVLIGTGSEFIEGNAGIPVIMVSWLDPGFMPLNVVIIINDSPLAQVREAVRLFSAGEKEGKIGSEIITQKGKILDAGILRKIQKMR
jgi:hypothetical protein